MKQPSLSLALAPLICLTACKSTEPAATPGPSASSARPASRLPQGSGFDYYLLKSLLVA